MYRRKGTNTIERQVKKNILRLTLKITTYFNTTTSRYQTTYTRNKSTSRIMNTMYGRGGTNTIDRQIDKHFPRLILNHYLSQYNNRQSSAYFISTQPESLSENWRSSQLLCLNLFRNIQVFSLTYKISRWSKTNEPDRATFRCCTERFSCEMKYNQDAAQWC